MHIVGYWNSHIVDKKQLAVGDDLEVGETYSPSQLTQVKSQVTIWFGWAASWLDYA